MTQILSDNDKQLASEYALGVLEREDIAIAEKRFDHDPLFRREVEEWQNRLTPMLDEVAEVKPSAAVWSYITNATSTAKTPVTSSLWQSLPFWRGFSIISSGLAVASLFALFFLAINTLNFGPRPSLPMFATLTPTGKAPAFIARLDNRSLVIRAATVDVSETRVAELWLIPSDGIPRSLGLLDDQGRGNLELSHKNQLVIHGSTLAISLEPAGGSPTGAPTGPVIATGKLALL